MEGSLTEPSIAQRQARYLLLDALDPVHEYRLSLMYIHIRERTHNWNRLSGGDRTLRKVYERLEGPKQLRYWRLIGSLREYVRRHIGEEQFSDPHKHFVWNWPTWHRLILKMAENSSGFDGENDCWHSTYSYAIDGSSRPKIHVSPGVTHRVVDRLVTRRTDNVRYRFALVEGCIPFMSQLARIAATLHSGPPLSISLQASHLCYNDPQLCFFPGHIIWESDALNKTRRYCVYGAKVLCRHRPRCIWTSIEGRFLPCRNQLIDELVCSCENDCFHRLPARLHESATEEMETMFGLLFTD